MCYFFEIYYNSEALHRVFALLKNSNNNIIFFDFMQFMKKYDPRIGQYANTCMPFSPPIVYYYVTPYYTAPYKVMCLFKVLQSSNGVEGCLTWDEFSNFYDYVDMRWELVSCIFKIKSLYYIQSHKSGLIVTWYEKMAKAPVNFKKVLKCMMPLFSILLSLFLVDLHAVVSHWLFDIVISKLT